MTTQAVNLTGTTVVLDEWMVQLERGGVSARNRQAHLTAVERLAEFMAPRSAEEVGPADLRGFLGYLGQLGVSDQSREVYRTILVKWMSHATGARKAREVEAAAVARVLSLEPPAEPPVDVAAEPWADALSGAGELEPVIEIIDDDAPVEAHAGDVRFVEGQAESTWPMAPPARGGDAPFGSIFGASATGSASSLEDAIYGADASLAHSAPAGAVPAPAAPVLAPVPIEPEPVVAARPTAAPTATADSFAGGGSPSAGETAQQSRTDPARGGAADDSGSALGLDLAPTAPATPGGALGTASLFVGPPITTFGAVGSTGPATGGAAHDATPARPFAAVVPGAAPIRVPRGDAFGSEQQMDPGVTSIPFATGGGGGAHEAVVRLGTPGSAAPAKEPKGKAQTWALRTNGTERADLDLSQIRNMVATGTLSPSALIRRPGGEWMKAGDYAPLKSVFQQARHEAASGGAGRTMPARREPNPRLAAATVLLTAVGSGSLAWWLAAVIASHEVRPLAVMVGLMAGVVGAWPESSRGGTGLWLGAVGALGALALGRAAVYQTLATGVMGGPNGQALDALAFLAEAFSPIGLAWWIAGVAAGVAAALVVGLVRRH